MGPDGPLVEEHAQQRQRCTDLDTPAVVVDLDVFDSNVARMVDVAAALGVSLRPHVKTHRCPGLGARQLQAGAVGVTVARLSEAEAFVRSPPADVLVAHPLATVARQQMLAAMAAEATVRTIVDNVDVAAGLSQAAISHGVELEVLLDVNTGLDRTGCAPVETPELADAIGRLPGLRLVGVFSYAGFRPRSPDHRVRSEWGHREGSETVAVAEMLRSRGHAVDIVSVGGTLCGPLAAEVPGVTEIRPGGYAVGDANYVTLGAIGVEHCALRVLSRVVSVPTRRRRAVIDAGSSVLGSDRSVAPGRPSFGLVPADPGIRIDEVWPDHAVLDTTAGERRLRVGDLVEVIPNHAGSTLFLAGEIHAASDGVVRSTLARVDAH